MVSIIKNKFVVIGFILLLILARLVYVSLGNHNKTDASSIIIENILLDSNEKILVVHASKPEKGLLIYIANKDDTKVNESYAKQFAALSYYVAVIDSNALLSSALDQTSPCLNLAKKLSSMSSQLQIHFKLDTNALPILVGIETGAATVYAALAQANEHQFHAAVSINFSPSLKTYAPLCGQQMFVSGVQNNQLYFTSVKRLPASFYIFQDKTSSSTVVDHSFTDTIGNVKLTITEGKDQSSLTDAMQILQWLDPRLADQISSDTSDSNLPLIEVTPEASIEANPTNSTYTDTMAIILTGDGGWAEIDKNLAKILAEKGIPTVALDSLSYFWKARTVEETSNDVEAAITQHLEKWNKKKVILIGYSFGADVLPFVANNLTADTQQKVALVALLGMGKTAAFEFKLSSWMNADKGPNRLPLLPEIEKMKWANSICIYGIEDEAANCLPTAKFGVKIISMSGDHHFDEKYAELVKHILDSQKPH